MKKEFCTCSGIFLFSLLIVDVVWADQSAAQAETIKLCSKGLKAVMVKGEDLTMTFTIKGKTTKFEYGGSLGTGLGITQWYPVDGSDTATEDDEDGAFTWNGRTYTVCK